MLTDATEPALRLLCVLSVWAHDLGGLLCRRDDPRVDRAYQEHLALLELEARADYCPIPLHDARVRSVWVLNFVRGWEAAATGEEHAPTLDTSGYTPGEELH